MRQINVIALGPQHVAESYALARMAFPRLSLTQWRSLANRWFRGSRGHKGALVARDATLRMVGLAAYQVRESLVNGRCLAVERLVCLGLLDSAPVQLALIEELVTLGRLQDCRNLEIGTDDRLDDLAWSASRTGSRSQLLHFLLREGPG